jgi:hypothetical protein
MERVAMTKNFWFYTPSLKGEGAGGEEKIIDDRIRQNNFFLSVTKNKIETTNYQEKSI